MDVLGMTTTRFTRARCTGYLAKTFSLKKGKAAAAVAAVIMSLFALYKRSDWASEGGDDGGDGGDKKKAKVEPFDDFDNLFADASGHEKKPEARAGKGKKKAVKESDEDKDELYFPADDDEVGADGLSTFMSSGMKMHKKKPVPRGPGKETEEHEYIRENCVVPTNTLKTFADVVGARVARCFAEQYNPVSTGAKRAVSGLLLFGPSGTGKSLLAQAITVHIGGTFYKLSMADLPTGSAAAANRIDALFDVAQSGPPPAVIFLDECDTILNLRATARVGHFAGRFERFADNLLVIGATNEPDKIAPKILTGRFERKIFVDNPSAQARKAMIERQLADEPTEHELSPADLLHIVEQTAGRSAVNMERLISTAALHAGCAPVRLDDFELALKEEPSDFDRATASKNAKFAHQHAWNP